MSSTLTWGQAVKIKELLDYAGIDGETLQRAIESQHRGFIADAIKAAAASKTLVEGQILVVDGVKYHRHPNGGGLVAETAYVNPIAYVGPFALIKDRAQVLDEARIEDRAVISGNATVKDKAYVSNSAQVFDSAEVSGSAVVFGDARVYHNTRICGSARVNGFGQIREGVIGN